MSHYIYDTFTKNFPVVLDRTICKQYIIIMYAFETRQKHTQALNSPYLGIDPIYFTPQDTQNLFDIFNIDMEDFKSAIRRCPSIDMNRKVSSDAYNLLISYLLHCTLITKELAEEEKLALMMALTKMLHYKFFTSLVKHFFPYGTSADIMQATINNLTEKFDIVKYGTWKKSIEARCADLIAPNSIHYKTLLKYDSDKDILYMITDTQTRLRSKIKLIVNEYYSTKDAGDSISSRTLTMDIDGEKIIKDQVGVLDSMTTNISNNVLNTNQWIDNNLIKLCNNMFTNINEQLLRQFLIAFSQYAALQVRQHKLDKIVKDKNKELYIGSRILIKIILQKVYRMCIQSRINMRNKLDILSKAKNTFAASRITDQTILDIKESVSIVLKECVHVTRESTLASLRIAFICYIVLKSFEYL